MIKVKFLSNINYQIYPECDDAIEIDEQQLNKIGKTLQFLNGELVPFCPKPNYDKEINSLKKWFSNYYTEHEQKYNRLISLNQLTDEGEDPKIKIHDLYIEAELKRKTIQYYENLENK